MLIHVLDALLPVQSPAMVWEKQQKMPQVFGSQIPTWETWEKLLASTCHLAYPSLVIATICVVNQQTEGLSFLFFLVTDFQINESLNKIKQHTLDCWPYLFPS